jgi:hypothetical protein
MVMDFTSHRSLWELYSYYTYQHALANKNGTIPWKNLMTPGLFLEFLAIYIKREKNANHVVDYYYIINELAKPGIFTNNPAMLKGTLDIYLDEEGRKQDMLDWNFYY